MLCEAEEGRKEGSIMAWMTWRRVPEARANRNRLLKAKVIKAPKPGGKMHHWRKTYPCRISGPADTNTQISQHEVSRTQVFTPSHLEMAVLKT